MRIFSQCWKWLHSSIVCKMIRKFKLWMSKIFPDSLILIVADFVFKENSRLPQKLRSILHCWQILFSRQDFESVNIFNILDVFGKKIVNWQWFYLFSFSSVFIWRKFFINLWNCRFLFSRQDFKFCWASVINKNSWMLLSKNHKFKERKTPPEFIGVKNENSFSFGLDLANSGPKWRPRSSMESGQLHFGQFYIENPGQIANWKRDCHCSSRSQSWSGSVSLWNQRWSRSSSTGFAMGFCTQKWHERQTSSNDFY